jgi:hypothetical protein
VTRRLVEEFEELRAGYRDATTEQVARLAEP